MNGRFFFVRRPTASNGSFPSFCPASSKRAHPLRAWRQHLSIRWYVGSIIRIEVFGGDNCDCVSGEQEENFGRIAFHFGLLLGLESRLVEMCHLKIVEMNCELTC